MFDCDRILAMDSGKIVEFDTPEALWANENSIFKQLANESELTMQNLPVKAQQHFKTPNIQITVAEVNKSEDDKT